MKLSHWLAAGVVGLLMAGIAAADPYVPVYATRDSIYFIDKASLSTSGNRRNVDELQISRGNPIIVRRYRIDCARRESTLLHGEVLSDTGAILQSIDNPTDKQRPDEAGTGTVATAEVDYVCTGTVNNAWIAATRQEAIKKGYAYLDRPQY